VGHYRTLRLLQVVEGDAEVGMGVGVARGKIRGALKFRGRLAPVFPRRKVHCRD
jgi:hypothetical protein